MVNESDMLKYVEQGGLSFHKTPIGISVQCQDQVGQSRSLMHQSKAVDKGVQVLQEKFKIQKS